MTDGERFLEHVRECAKNTLKLIRCRLGPTKDETTLCPDGKALQVKGAILAQEARRRSGVQGDELRESG